jgi:UDP-N-acetylglucosamine--N-acetylmuramyl-(pentapeptide) pyrophosphoryl-undecaprenol N-acetylglucosamine transferase
MKIILSGGGTLGPVTPLLAIFEIVKKEYPDADFLWIGTKKGPERELLESRGIRFISIPSGKFRRYVSLWNIVDLFRIALGSLQALWIIFREDPDLCISAGGFVSVPVHWAGWLFGVPTWIHQQDVRVGFANKLMAPFARIVTTALEASEKYFSKKKVLWLGNPVRQEILEGSKTKGLKRFHLQKGIPVVFATGGGTGSMRVNQLIIEAVAHLGGHAQIIHLSGKERPQELVNRAVKHFDYYQVHQFFMDEMKDAYAAADIVISRGGFGTITEIAALGKPAILIPKPGHQVENVRALAGADAVIVVDETTADGNYLAKTIRELAEDKEKQKRLGEKLHEMMPVAKKEDILYIVEQFVRS